MNKKRIMLKVGIVLVAASLMLCCVQIGSDVAVGKWHDVGLRGLAFIWEMCCLCCTLTIYKLVRTTDSLFDIIHDELKEIERLQRLFNHFIKCFDKDKENEKDI